MVYRHHSRDRPLEQALFPELFSHFYVVLPGRLPRNGLDTVFVFLLFLENLLISLPMPLLTVYLLHYCCENMRSSKLFRAVVGLWAVYLVLSLSIPFISGFARITPQNQYYRGPLYPLLLLPLISILLLNFTGALRRRAQLTSKVLLSFFIATLPMTVVLFVHMFVDIYPLIDFCTVLSALSMYGLILSDQIEQDRLRQQEIILQEREIAKQATGNRQSAC